MILSWMLHICIAIFSIQVLYVAYVQCWMQINASDDRSASSIETKILDVVQMNSILSDSKPKCLVSWIMLPKLSNFSLYILLNFVSCLGNRWNWWSTWWWKRCSGGYSEDGSPLLTSLSDSLVQFYFTFFPPLLYQVFILPNKSVLCASDDSLFSCRSTLKRVIILTEALMLKKLKPERHLEKVTEQQNYWGL